MMGDKNNAMIGKCFQIFQNVDPITFVNFYLDFYWMQMHINTCCLLQLLQQQRQTHNVYQQVEKLREHHCTL